MTDLERAQSYFANDLFATQAAGANIEWVESGRAKCSMRVQKHHKNALGNVMGGALFTLADYAFAVASNFDKRPTVSQNCNVTFLSAPHGDVLFAVAEQIKEGKNTCLYQINVTDNEGRLCAHMTVNGFIVG